MSRVSRFIARRSRNNEPRHPPFAIVWSFSSSHRVSINTQSTSNHVRKIFTFFSRPSEWTTASSFDMQRLEFGIMLRPLEWKLRSRLRHPAINSTNRINVISENHFEKWNDIRHTKSIKRISLTSALVWFFCFFFGEIFAVLAARAVWCYTNEHKKRWFNSKRERFSEKVCWHFSCEFSASLTFGVGKGWRVRSQKGLHCHLRARACDDCWAMRLRLGLMSLLKAWLNSDGRTGTSFVKSSAWTWIVWRLLNLVLKFSADNVDLKCCQLMKFQSENLKCNKVLPANP